MTWSNTYDQMRIATLNGNVILPYWLPGEEHSGLGLIGTNNIDETLCTIFDHLKGKGEVARVVSVPEFVVASIRYPSMFKIKPVRKYDEYIVSVSKYYPLTSMNGPRRLITERALKRAGEENITVRSLKLSSVEDRDYLLGALTAWQSKNINDYGMVERDAIKLCVLNAKILNIQNACIYICGIMYGFCLYEISADGKYATVLGVKATHKRSLGFELIAYAMAKWFMQQGIELVNLNYDLGLLRLRGFMLTLGPINFFRKYIIEPAT
jgi:hypothetical protein